MTPACPRCAYDLSGIASTWTDRCPLAGTCSECGLDLHWVDAYFPDRERVRGLIEHSRGPFQSAWWSLRTLWLVARPWSFWRRVTMAMTPHTARAFAWVGLLTLAFWVAGSLCSNAVFLYLHATGYTSFSTAHGVFNGWTQPVIVSQQNYTWTAPLYVATPAGFIWDSLPAPLGDPDSGGTGDFAVAATAASVLVGILTWPLLFLVLRDTRKLGRVHRRHILRAVAYSTAALALLPFLRFVDVLAWSRWAAAGYTTARGWRTAPWSTLGRLVPLDLAAAAAALLWVQLWWCFAISRGFRLNAALPLWSLLAVVSLLASAVTWLLLAGTGRWMSLF